ncbi:alpha/beta hydrolase, PF06259 family [Actinomyces sp. ICM54]|uniref:alpha/beta hydrolase n=1 Tax=Actinomyces sp. ICM54 TaxID=936549 RepID=UPI00044C4E49|nr:alpha/beta hydrolase [Actinomyces sp. ICM54]EWC94615.1 alpha/beta hydrolase, PF06259 family [Actinomyces sp. ICM54]
MATWADIQSWDHNAIIEAEDLIEAEVREAREIIADLEHAANDIRSQGEAPDRMRERLSEIQDKLDSRLNELTEYALATAELHGYVSRVVAIRESAYEVAAELHETIPESGYVMTPPMELSNNPDRYEKYQDLHACIKSAVDLATEAETTVGPRYRALADGQYVLSEGRHSESAGLANDADPSWTPEEVSVWWKLLSDSEREALINKDPEKYGNLDGIDMASRAKANELALNGYFDAAGNRIPGLLEKAQKEYDEAKAAYEKGRDSFWGSQYSDDEGYERLLNAKNKLDDLKAVKKALKGKDVSLISLEYGEPGKNVLAALAIGDVDNAEYVATLVPGMTTNCRDSTALNLSYASNLRAAAVKAGADPGNVATIAWLGYDAPPALPDPSVASTAQAEAGAVSLRNFMTGIHSWRAERGLDVYQTGITHSYGSTTGGIAMRSIGKDVVDGFAYTGSPGAGVASVGTLGVDKDHVWVSAVPHHDAVQGVGTDGDFGLDPKTLKGIGHLSGDASGAKDYSTYSLNPVANHSSYFVAPEPGKENHALNDLGKVIADAKER